MINSYEKRISELTEEKKDLELSFAESGFLSQVQEKIRALDFQKAVSVKYIQVPDSSLATARK